MGKIKPDNNVSRKAEQVAIRPQPQPDKVTARGHTCVTLVINMQQFVARESHSLFASARGSEVFSHVLRHDWPARLKNSQNFVASYDEGGDNAMSADETGFVTGIFRQNMLNYYSAPDYKLNKKAIDFPEELRNNWQFKKLFEPIWKQWDIYIRPTMTGMFIIRLVRRYEKATSLLNVSQNVIKLQTSFDVHSAIDQFARLEEEYKDDPETLRKKRQSVDALLHWLGVDPANPPALRYAPVQWQLAMEIGRRFIQEVGERIDLKQNGNGHIDLVLPERGASQPIHDSFVIYHLDELLTTLSKEQPYTVQRTTRVVVPEDFQHSKDIRQHIVNLLEGSMLRKHDRSHTDAGESTRYFPTHSAKVIDNIFRCDMSTWDDELLLLTARSALVLPSRRAMNAELFISTLPTTADSSVMYSRYWDALERMFEFVAEIRVLAQLLERASEDLLQDFVTKLRRMRQDMLNDVLSIDPYRNDLTELVNQSANLSRLVSVCQSMSNPQVWSRAEYGADKAEHLVQEMKIDVLLENTQRNVSSLTGLVNHVDELYLAGLSEDNNRETFWMSLILAALSLSIILFSLPSFWADSDQLNSSPFTQFVSQHFVPILTAVGSVLAPFIIGMSLLLSLMGVWRTYRARKQRHFRRELANRLRV